MKKIKRKDQDFIKETLSVFLCMVIFCLTVFQFNIINTKAMAASQGTGVAYVTRVDLDANEIEPPIIFAESAPEIDEEETNETTDISEEVTESGPRFYLSDYERAELESLVMAEAGAESYEGQMAVAQCIIDACEKEGKQPSEIAVMYRYTKHRPKPNESVKEAIRAVFDRGEVVTEAKILYFYAPAIVYSSWHESQTYITTIGGHRFFAEA